jgi:tetratricopeptide (TPR) repeat protein
VYGSEKLWDQVKSFAEDCLEFDPNDPVALKYLAAEQKLVAQVAAAETAARTQPSPENFLQLSTSYQRMGRYQDCVAAAQQALRLRPDFAEAYNSMAAAYVSMGQRDEAIRAASKALRLKPDFPSARNNLESAKTLRAP